VHKLPNNAQREKPVVKFDDGGDEGTEGNQAATALGFSFAFFQLAVASLNLFRDSNPSVSDTIWNKLAHLS